MPRAAGFAGRAAISVRGLSHTYRSGGAPAVHDVDFEVEAGEVFGFLGPSGAGKSTTQRILVRLLRGWSGEVEVLGRNLLHWDDSYFEGVGVSFELPNHYPKLSARENLVVFRGLYSGATEDPDALLAAVGLAEHADERVGTFSKGMSMRLNLARALIPQPEVLLLDEPTAGLDPVTARLVKDLVRAQQRRGCAVFLTTHDMAVADELCDRVAFLVDGSIVATGAPRDLRLSHGGRTVAVEVQGGGSSQLHRFPLEGLADNARFLELLRAGAIETMHTQEASLEQVFVAVTGRRLE